MITATVTRTVTVTEDTQLDPATLNSLGTPSVTFSGTMGEAEVANGAISKTKTKVDAHFYAVTTGTSTAYAVALPSPAGSLVDGMVVRIRVHTACGNAPTLAVDGLTPKLLKKNVNQSLSANDLVQYQDAVVMYDGQNDVYQVVSVLAVGASLVIGQEFRNLVVKSNTGAPTTSVDITADELVVKSASGLAKLLTGVSETVVLAGAGVGANQLDVGTEAADTWYYLWVVYNQTTEAVAAVFSLNSTGGPNFSNLAGYSYYALVGAARNDGSSNLRRFHQFGREVWQTAVLIFDGKVHPDGTTYALVSSGIGAITAAPNTALPAIAKVAAGMAGGARASGTDARSFLRFAGDSNGVGELQISGASADVEMGDFSWSGRYEVPLITAQDFYLIFSATLQTRLVINGWKW